jgi:hypothetical protein
MPSTSSNLFSLRAVLTLGKRKCSQETGIVVTSLDEVLAWCESPLLLLMRESVWDELCAYFPPPIFMENLTNHPPSFWEPIDDLVSPFHGHRRFCLHFERLKDAGFLDHPEDPHDRL